MTSVRHNLSILLVFFDIQICTTKQLRSPLSITFSIFVFPLPVPCAPTNIWAQMDIMTGTAILSWYLSAGALRYKAVAVSSISGTSVSCETNQTNCNLINLLCGDKYNVTIQAVGSVCNNSASMGRYLQTGDVLFLTYYIVNDYAILINLLELTL